MITINHGSAFTTHPKMRYKGGRYVDKYKVTDLYVDHSVTKEPLNVDESLLLNVLDNDVFIENQMLSGNNMICKKKRFSGIGWMFLVWYLPWVDFDSSRGRSKQWNIPLACAITESENKDSWQWFIDCIGDNLDLFRNSNFTFISDRRKGVIPAIAETFSGVEHMFCLKHIYDNMKLSWEGQMYRRCYGDMQQPLLCIDVKDKPIITCLEFTKEYLMKRIVNVQKVISKSDGPLTPNPAKLFKTIVKDAGQINEKSTIPNTIVPLKVHPQIVGIPKKKERRVLLNWLKEWLEENKFSRAGKSISCIKCKGIGHNQRRCTNDPYASDPKVTQTQQSSQAPTATQASQTTPTTST
ncbi:mutator type transposase [Tanacetum coccineum]|uniref:Mutator type transposase n=1 Tax=Tanacetum coccineum TaxID=301880 RepID=A0ABQ5A6R2_9ASTR